MIKITSMRLLMMKRRNITFFNFLEDMHGDLTVTNDWLYSLYFMFG